MGGIMEAAAYIFQTKLGWVGISSSTLGLQRFILPQSSFIDVCRQLGANLEPDPELPVFLHGIVDRLKLYFNGYKTSFPDDLDLSAGTEFQRKVWEATRLIPYGETRSYSWIAEKIGNRNAVRAVGHALGQNPLPIIIPCHRVLNKDGGLGGYGGGLELKRYLLWLEASAYMRDRTA
jgi:methylated-DNA-[protein]-cysteine S-methyltransferase